MQCAIARASYAQTEDVSHSSDSLLVPGLSSGQPGPVRGVHGGKALGRPQDLGSQVDSRKGTFCVYFSCLAGWKPRSKTCRRSFPWAKSNFCA